MVEQPYPVLFFSVEFLMVVISDDAGIGHLLSEVESLCLCIHTCWSYSDSGGEGAIMEQFSRPAGLA